MPGVARTPEGCTDDKAKQGLALLSSLLSFFASQRCRMGTPICNTEKGSKIHPGHPWAAERMGGHCREQGAQRSHGNRCQLSFLSCWWRNPYGNRTRGEWGHSLLQFILLLWPHSPPVLSRSSWLPQAVLDLRLYPQPALEQSRGTCGYLLMQYQWKALSSGGVELPNKAGMQDHTKHPIYTPTCCFPLQKVEKKSCD